MKKALIIILIAVALLAGSFLPLWNKPVRMGTIRINTWDYLRVKAGLLFID